MAKSEVRIEGLSELLEALKALPKELGSKGGGPIKGSLFAATKIVRDEARLRAPVDTGKLQRNIVAFRDPDPRSSGVTEAYYITWRKGRRRGQKRRKDLATANSDKDAYYGRFVEFGTSKMPARPFLRPAFEALKDQALQKFKNELARQISVKAKKLARMNRGR